MKTLRDQRWVDGQRVSCVDARTPNCKARALAMRSMRRLGWHAGRPPHQSNGWLSMRSTPRAPGEPRLPPPLLPNSPPKTGAGIAPEAIGESKPKTSRKALPSTREPPPPKAPDPAPKTPPVPTTAPAPTSALKEAAARKGSLPPPRPPTSTSRGEVAGDRPPGNMSLLLSSASPPKSKPVAWPPNSKPSSSAHCSTSSMTKVSAPGESSPAVVVPTICGGMPEEISSSCLVYLCFCVPHLRQVITAHAPKETVATTTATPSRVGSNSEASSAPSSPP
mmetsp:Transcript_3585/g.13117  ORF Transcript_3585/g.13117 Transcript_3585/m.13117 type:complete len:278 (+) Transcript_3585:91-924(+)